MNRFGSLRLRIVVAFIVLLAVTLAAAGSWVYVSTERRLVEEMDLDLQLAADQTLAHLVTVDGGRYALQEAGGPALIEAGQEDLGIAVLSAAGEQWDHVGAQMPAALLLAGAPFTTKIDGRDWRVLAQPIEPAGSSKPGWVQVVRSLRPVDDALSALATQLYIVLPLAVLMAAVLSYFLAGRALRPLTQIARTAGQIGGTTLGKRIGYRGPADEVGSMATAFDSMLDRVQMAFERERRFSADASHELRTPLAAIKSGIGVSLSRRRRSGEYRETLEKLDLQVDQLIRLCDDLLMLARGGRPRSTDLESVDVTALLELVVDQFAPMAEERAITLDARIGQRLSVDGFADDLIRLFANLLGNALKYTPAGGAVMVDAGRRQGQVRVLISDTGAGIAAEHLPHLFEPFYQADASRDRRERGTGLGLAIAQEIVAAHGGAISAESTPGKGTTFEVSLPG